ncbi:centromere protein Q isoform X1 [Tenrec ecaudatus]|uniref:centromere protein Q isoform X1 n=1 Tax=Tenrec ecaudatus TaxID=94439 RepID=UPI003F5A76D3
MSGKVKLSKEKAQQLKTNPKRKGRRVAVIRETDDEEMELSESEVKSPVKNNKQKHLSPQVTGKTKQTNLKRIKIAPNKRKTWKPLSKINQEHLQAMIESTVLTILSNNVKNSEKIQYHLNFVKKRLLQLCETLKVPPTNLKNITNVSNLLKMEKAQHKANEEDLTLLQEEVDKIVETIESVTGNIHSLKSKIQILTNEVEEVEKKTKQVLQLDHSGVLNLPELSESSLKAPLLQDEMLTLIPNQNALLKDLETLHKSSQMKNMLTFIEEAYNKLDTS